MNKVLAMLTVCCLLLGSIASGAAAPGSQAERVHPLLRQHARERPDQLVDVIVQMRPASRLKEKDLPQNAQAVREFGFINAQVLRLPPPGSRSDLSEQRRFIHLVRCAYQGNKLRAGYDLPVHPWG